MAAPWAAWLLLAWPGGAQDAARGGDPSLSTVAESSAWRATSTHAQVVQLCRQLERASPRVHMLEVGTTVEGRSLPLLVLAEPPVETPDQVGDRLVAFAWGGIHSGEVCGKPATLMLARELGLAADPALLESVVVLFLPLLNADGNERMSPDNRPGQKGPELGMGIRPNAQGLNINRDWTKLETPEAWAVVDVLNRWDPDVAMDLHTTNGSRHQYVLTYDAPRNPASDDGLRTFARDVMLPEVSRRMQAETGYKSTFYGNFRRGNTQWRTYPAQLRYSTHYLGMRHHIGLLSEAYSYAEYEDRVRGTAAFVRHCFQFAAEHKDRIEALRVASKQHGGSRDGALSLRQESKLSEQPVAVLGYAGGRGEPQGEPRTYEVRYDGVSESTLAVELPPAYLFPPSFGQVAETLTIHGITVDVLREEASLEVEVYRIDAIERDSRAYEKHRMVAVEVTPRTESRRLPAGAYVVRTAQPLGRLAAYLLEPRSEDGLCAWNFFDDPLTEGGDFGVVRLSGDLELTTAPLGR